MYLKLIFKNVVKNIKDYGIYFFTLMISVAVFYSFNSIESQPVIKAAQNSNGNMMKTLIPMIHLISWFVAIMLAFLIIYANQFLLKRRKKELGIYMILGMSESRMSGIFVGETLIIGIMAMIFGMGIGVIMSQGISMFAIKMFAYDLSEYRFAFSMDSFKETMICFAIIFVAVMILNVITITKVKLIDLLTASRKNERMGVEKTGMFVIVFLCSLILFGLAGYLLYYKNGLSFKTKEPAIVVVAICVGTAMLIYSISGVVLKLLQKNKKWYLKGINSFLVRQISSKIQTNYLTMTVVSLLLTGTICIISVGMGMASSMNDMVKNATPFDIVLYKVEKGVNESKESFYDDLQAHGMELDKAVTDYEIITSRIDKTFTYKEILSDTEHLAPVDVDDVDSPVTIISVSDYNADMRLQGKEEITLADGQYMINSNYRGTDKNIQAKYDSKPEITVGGTKLVPANDTVLHNTYYLTVVGMNDKGTVIVPDSVAETLDIDLHMFVGMMNPDYDEQTINGNIINLYGDVIDSQYSGYTKGMIQAGFYGTFAVAAFVACYIGVILLIICVALLSLQQLTETNDNVYRYQLLGKLGVERNVQNSALFKQIMMYFGVPLVVACIYAAAGLPKVVQKIKDMLAMEVGSRASVIIILMVVIYGSYFLITYFSCRRIIAEKKGRSDID
ncbi:MAG: ABC transporter permease [Eubacterium sp.]|nr:ABC transporter permease [Eubacterium sp.]